MDVDQLLAIVDKFELSFPRKSPALLLRDGMFPEVVRLTNVSSTMGEDGGHLFVRWVPFGDTGNACIACRNLPDVFEGVRVRYHQERATPLLPEELAQDDFAHEFMLAEAGVIEGDDGTPVRLCGASLSNKTALERTLSYGCPAGETAILVDWIPAGLQHSQPDPNRWPEESGIDPAKVPLKSEWAVFPKTYQGFNVYYKRGAMAFAL